MRSIAHAEILERELTFPITKRATTAKAEQLTIVSGRRFNAHHPVLRLASRAIELGRLSALGLKHFFMKLEPRRVL
jgi:hypothetical protein